MSCAFPGRDDDELPLMPSSAETDWKVLHWDRPTLKRFKVIVKMADEVKAETIMFDGNEFDVTYAKYLAQYIEEKLE